MPQSFRLKRFTNVAILKRIDFPLLLDFFESDSVFREFLVRRGLTWTRDAEQFDYAELARILMSPGVDTPEAFLDALYFVDNLADGDCYDRILQEAQDAGIDLGTEDPSPEDLSLRVWLADRNILERVHAEQYRLRPKKFESYFAGHADLPDLGYPSDVVLSALEADLNEWFDFKKKGRGAKVFPFPKEDGFWFLVRHGQRIKREGTVKADDSSGSVFYRPEKFDVLIYYPETGELAIYAETKGEREAYCTQFGRHLFHDEAFFCFDAPVAKYTLQPLIELGRDALACGDVEGVEYLHLYNLHYVRESNMRNKRTIWGDDVFTDLETNGPDLIEPGLTLVKAKFRVTFTGGRERIVSIEPPNVASFDRETDNSMIYDWLIKRGFILTIDAEAEEHVEPETVLEMA